ncbi:hypothetical protein [Paractinoplanes maris]|uniref:hypothetical protein n=1 Tax=Paractinoplanes maris TaxID=1734446 RepID=UPI002021AF09|nr:hypothetical protein [Actinoplanes maris]
MAAAFVLLPELDDDVDVELEEEEEDEDGEVDGVDDDEDESLVEVDESAFLVVSVLPGFSAPALAERESFR